METSARLVGNVIMYNTKNDTQVLYEPNNLTKAVFRTSCINLQAIFPGLGIRERG